MQKLIPLYLLSFVLFGCHKSNTRNLKAAACNMQQVYAANAKKVTVTSGIWGTLSNMSGNCMPTIPASNSSCAHCPASRTIQIYAYTRLSEATPYPNPSPFFTAFNTPPVAEVEADEEGFFQVALQPGHYSIAVVIDGKLYANGSDADGGINPVTYTNGKQNVNLVMTYDAVF